MRELRCWGNKLHALVVKEGVIEVRCRSKICGARSGVVVIHRFDTMTGELLSTKAYKKPQDSKEVSDAAGHTAAVRTA